MLSAVLTVQIVGDHLRSGGSIVNVVPENPREGSADAAIKAAVSNWTAGQAAHFGTRGITVNAVASGRSAEPGYDGLGRLRRRWPRRSPGWRCSSPRRPPATSPGRRCTSATVRWPTSARYSRVRPKLNGVTAPLRWSEGVTIRLGLQIPNFSYGTGVAELFPTVIAQAQEAEAAGFDSVFVMDHFYQLPGLGTPDQPMLEAYTALGGLATATERVQLGTLVTGNTYRNPTLLAKAITTLDVISQGRAILGIGTGWFELEHDSLGYEFGTFTDRFNKLGEALQIILPMLDGRAADVHRQVLPHAGGDGRSPLPRPHSADDRRQRREEDDSAGGQALRPPQHHRGLRRAAPQGGGGQGDAARRSTAIPATLETSMLVIAMIDENVTADMIPDDFKQQVVFGSAEQVAEQIKTKVLDAGVDGVILSPVTSMDGYHPGGITAVGEALKPLLTG